MWCEVWLHMAEFKKKKKWWEELGLIWISLQPVVFCVLLTSGFQICSGILNECKDIKSLHCQ